MQENEKVKSEDDTVNVNTTPAASDDIVKPPDWLRCLRGVGINTEKFTSPSMLSRRFETEVIDNLRKYQVLGVP